MAHANLGKRHRSVTTEVSPQTPNPSRRERLGGFIFFYCDA